MDGKRSDPLSDAALDRELATALQVDPSPEFMARVRLRVAAEPRRAGWRLAVGFAAVAAVAAIVAVAVTLITGPLPVGLERRDTAAVPQAARERAGGAAQETPRPAAPDVDTAQSAGLRPGAARRPRRVETLALVLERTEPGDAPPFADVLVSAEEVRAFELLVAAILQQRVPPMPPADEAPGLRAVELPEIGIAPLVIEPLPQIARLEQGERQ